MSVINFTDEEMAVIEFCHTRIQNTATGKMGVCLGKLVEYMEDFVRSLEEDEKVDINCIFTRRGWIWSHLNYCLDVGLDL
jgi:hypothetical protein